MVKTHHERKSRYKSGDKVKITKGKDRGRTSTITSVERSRDGQILYYISTFRSLYPAGSLKLVRRKK